EHAERDLREVDAGQAALDRVVALLRRALVLVGDVQPRHQHAEADDEPEGDQQREAAGAQRVQLGELGRDHARVGDGGHPAASYSTASRVSSMKASSSEAWRAASSWSVTLCAAARSPICSLLRPATSSTPGAPEPIVTPSAWRISLRREA